MEVSSEERMKEGFGVSMTSGSSMRPLIWGGEHCVAVAPLDGEPVPGDILMFRYGSGSAARSIVHRLIAIQSPGEHDESSHVRSRPVATNAGGNFPAIHVPKITPPIAFFDRRSPQMEPADRAQIF